MKSLLMLLLVGGCSLGVDRSTPQGQCQADAYNDPAVKDAISKMAVGSPELQNDLLPVKDAAYRSAVNRCLAARGLGPAGGVERRRPPV